jgi:ATP phosphoribosyltransferase
VELFLFYKIMEKISIAIQKSGRLNEGSLKLLKECGISIDNGKKQLKASSPNFPIEVLYLRNKDIPSYVQDGVADIAILGENVVIESEAQVEVLDNLKFSKCKLSLAIPKAEDYSGLSYFNNKKIATSYPNSLKAFLNENGIKADIHKISGSVEIAPNIGLADAICDLVSTGSTLLTNGLKEVEEVLRSEAVLVANKNLSDAKKETLDQLRFRLKSVMEAKNKKYVLLNAPKENIGEISKLLHGVKSPTVTPLADEQWCSLQAVVKEGELWNIIDDLKKLGAEDIIILPIEKIIV